MYVRFVNLHIMSMWLFVALANFLSGLDKKKNVVCDETIFNRLLNFELRPQHCFSESSGSEYEGTVEPLNTNNNIVVGTM